MIWLLGVEANESGHDIPTTSEYMLILQASTKLRKYKLFLTT